MKSIGILLLIPFILTLDNGLGKTPQMGWNSWNKYGCDISEDLIKKQADALVETGLAAKGYIYVNLDDCWQTSRDAEGKIVPDPERFKSGIKALSKYVHSNGLKFGLYSDAGRMTCAKRPGSLGHEEIDAKTYAEWEVDYLKYDNCFNELLPSKPRYTAMRDALLKTGRPIFYSICSWGWEGVWQWGKDVGNSWRTTGDIKNEWSSFISILDKQHGLDKYAGPNGWNDPDMLEVGNGGMQTHEYQAHFAIWALLKAPLLLGNDITNMDKDTYDILSNEEIIAINQDPLGKQGKRISRSLAFTGFLETYIGELVDGWAVILFNRTLFNKEMTFRFKNIGKESGCLRDLVQHKDLGSFKNSFTATVDHRSVLVLKITDC